MGIPNHMSSSRSSQYSVPSKIGISAQGGLPNGEEQLKAMLKSIADEVWIVDTAGNVLWVNDAVQKNLGAEPGRWPNIYDAIKDLEICYPDGTPRPPERSPLQRALDGESLNKAEEVVRNLSTGERRWREVSASPIRDAQGTITGAVCIVRDITEHKQAEIQLKELAQRYATVLESSTDCIQFFDHNWTVTFTNRRAEQTLGMESMTGKNIWELFPEAVGGKFYVEYHRALRENVPVHFVEFYPPLGMWLEINAYPSPEGLAVYFRDVTERKNAEDAQLKSEERLRATFDHAAMGIVEVDRRGRFLAANSRACQILGYERDELLKLDVHTLTAPEDRPRSDELNAQLNEGGIGRIDYEKRYLRKDGTPLWVHVTVSAVRDSQGRFLHAIGTIEDIDERKRTEEALRESEAKLQLIINRAPVLISYIGRDYRYKFINGEYEAWFNVKKEDCVEKPVVEVLGDAAFKKLLPYMERALAGEMVMYEDWAPYRTGRRFIHANYVPDIGEDGKVRGFIVLVNDLTERERAERERERLVELLSEAVSGTNRSKAQLEAVFHAMQDGVMVFDMGGGVVLVNEAEARILGYASIEELDKDLTYFSEVFELRTADGSKLSLEQWPISRVMRGETITDCELRGRRTDTGREWYFNFSGEPVFDEDGKQALAVIITRDITERKRAELALRESQGDLNRAQAVAHTGSWRLDVRNDRLLWSDEAYRIFDISIGTPMTYALFVATIHPEDREYVDCSWQAALRGEPYDIEHRIMAGDKIKWVREKAELEFDKQGKLAGGFGTVQDITERKAIEAQARLVQDRLEIAQRAASIGNWDTDVPTGTIWWSSETYRIYGIPEGTPITLERFFELVHPDDIVAVRTHAADARKSEGIYAIDHRIVRPDGEVRYVHEHGRMFFDAAGKPARMVGIVQDITERKQVEQELRDTRASLEEAQRIAKLGSWDNDLRTWALRWSPEAYAIFGIPDGTPMDTDKFLSLVHPDDRQGLMELSMQARAGNAVFELDHRIIHPDGNVHYVHEQARVIFDKDGKPTRMVGTVQDITERKKAEIALRESETRFRAVFNTAAVGMTTASVPEGRFLTVNQKMAEITGYTVDELVRMSFLEITHPDDREANIGLFEELIAGSRQQFSYQKRYFRKGGRIIWVEVTVALMRDTSGAPLHTVAVVEDITARKEMEQALRESEQLFRELADAMPQIVWSSRPDGTVDYYNRQWYDFTGMDPSLIGNQSWEPIIHPDDVAMSSARWQESIRTGERYEMECRYKDRHTGTFRWFLVRALPIRDDSEKIIRWFGTSTDIDDQKRSQAALLESEARFRMIAEASPNIVWTARPDGEVDYYNVRWEEYSGIKRTAGHGWGWAPVVHPEDDAATKDAWSTAVKTGGVYQIEHRIRRHDGQFRWFLSRGVALRDDAGKIIKWFGTATDIHDSKMAQQVVRESEEKFRLLTETLPQLVWTCDSEGMCDYANQQHLLYTGMTTEQTLGRGWLAVVHPDDAAQVFPKWTAASRRKEPFDMEYRLRRADGEYRWFYVDANPVLGHDGEIIKWVGTCTDIHSQRRATDNLKFVAHLNDIVGQSLDHGERLSNMANGCVPYLADWCIIEIINQDGVIERAAVANADRTKVAAVLEAAQKFPLHFNDRCRMTQILAEGKPRLYPDADETALREIARNDAHLTMLRQYGLCSFMILPLIARGKTLGAVLLVNSTSGRRFTEEDLSFAEEVVHRFAIAIDNSMLYNDARAALSLRDDFLSIASHELKTPVTSIKAFLQALEQRMRKPESFDFKKNAEYMELSIKQVDRLATLIGDLLDMNRINKGTMEYRFAVAPIGPILAEVVERMSASFPTHKMVCKLQDLRSSANLDLVRFEQALTNLITNAVKYSPQGSTVEIQMKNEEDSVIITVSDQGIGIPPEQLAHIFNPYYRAPGAISTRAGGLGIGLFISLQLIRAHGGTLDATSEVGKGSTFTIRLPCMGKA